MDLSFALSCIMLATWLVCGKCDAAPELINSVHRRLRSRPVLGGYTFEYLGEDEDTLQLNKRQQFDDYGHMRFGKREQFDDYGHLRFGKNHE